jgi:hypothetical protein
MAYSDETLVQLAEKYQEVSQSHKNLLLDLMFFRQKLGKEKSKEYLMQGVGRRLDILTRSIDNVYSIFPPNRKERLSKVENADIVINLHAFFINITGVFDNLAWVFVHENNLLGKSNEGKISRNGVGLFCQETQEHIAEELRDYLNSDQIISWYTEYSKNYRDSLAHRIPLYVPPFILNDDEGAEYKAIENQINDLDFTRQEDRNKSDELHERQQNLGRISHFLSHSLEEGCRPVYFHAQVIADFLTVKETIGKFIEHF